jgi:hypothetical protein
MAPSVSEDALFSATNDHILRAMHTFGGKPAAEWLPLDHPAAPKRFPRKWFNVARLERDRVIDAVAASAPNHCLDGWSYAARAMSAFLAGDLHAARHLSYYAQLRAGLSILGNLGVGIFNGINFAIDRDGAIRRIDPDPRNPNRGLGTHDAVWDAWSKWVENPDAARRFLEILRIGGVSLASCLDAIWPGTIASSVASELVEAWGIDLKRGRTDHRARNISSYDPQAFEPLPDAISEMLGFVEKMWSLFEPTSLWRFDLLDRHLLKSVLWRRHELLGEDPWPGPLARRYEELPESVRNIASRSFLLGESEPDFPEIFRLAQSRSDPAMASEMMARALLLLRTATGFTNSNFNDAGVRSGGGALRQWIDPFSASRGFWRPDSPLENLADLWEDVRLALEDFNASKATVPNSLNEWIRKPAVGLPIVAEVERVGVWSLGS